MQVDLLKVHRYVHITDDFLNNVCKPTQITESHEIWIFWPSKIFLVFITSKVHRVEIIRTGFDHQNNYFFKFAKADQYVLGTPSSTKICVTKHLSWTTGNKLKVRKNARLPIDIKAIFQDREWKLADDAANTLYQIKI